MKFSDVINFQPIESVIQIKDSNDESKAREYVKTFVISDRLSESLSDLIIPQLQFDDPFDNKGLMIIGNFGTGKSHLLSVISSLAEYSGMLKNLQRQDVVESCKKIDGKFIVFRLELGAVTQNLRDIICSQLEKFLKLHNISYQFPTTNIANNKQSLEDMMIKFQEKFPEQGFLLVIDELLAYLISREDLALINDLEFLRELGEFCKSSKFRLIAGLQASLFVDPRFHTAADTVRKVKDRFEQLEIVKDDLDYVISKRLLNKTQEQKNQIESHLNNFISLYPTLQAKTDKFIELYPLHPSYTEILQRVTFIEKRHIFKYVSNEIKNILDKEIDPKNLGMISFDSYWKIIKSEPSLKTDEDIRQVIHASSALENKVEDAMETAYKEMALRIIHALSVHRLTTGGDIEAPVGMTTAELRDMLFLHAELPEKDPEFLESTIETTLEKIRQATSGSFISQNSENLQWHIDVKKDVDYDAKISKKITSLDDIKKDRYFFEILQKVMETPDVSYVTDRKIWQSEIEWEEKKINRNGYLFFGAPNERSTAQPPRDFYMYFLQHFKIPSFTDEKKSDEVFFKFKNIDSEIEEDVLFYCGARDLEIIASQSTKQIYSHKAEQRLKKIANWMKESGLSNIQVTFQGNEKNLLEIPIAKKGANFSFKEIVNSISSYFLKEHFNQKYPDYPVFDKLVTGDNMEQYVKDTLKSVSNPKYSSKISSSILSNLGLTNNHDEIDTSLSKYAQAIKNKLESKSANEVLNRDEFMTKENDQEFESEFHLENDWVAVILSAMVYTGDLIIGYSGKKISAENISEINGMSYDDLLQFRHVQRPSGIPVDRLKELSTLLELPPGLFAGQNLDPGVESLQNRITENLKSVITLNEQISSGIRFWDVEVYDLQEQENLKNILDDFKQFLDSLQKYDTSAKIKNLQLTKDEISQKQIDYNTIEQLEQIWKIILKISPLTSYLSQTNMGLTSPNNLSKSMEEKQQMMNKIKQNPTDEMFQETKIELEEIKQSYIQEYYDFHKKSRLDSQSDEKLVSILNSSSLKKLQKLRNISLLEQSKLSDLENKFSKLKSCLDLEKSELESSPKCNHCNYTPSIDGVYDSKERLSELESELSTTEQDMTKAISENLDDPTVKTNLEAQEKNKRKSIDEFISQNVLPDEITDTFVDALNEVFTGLEKATLSIDELRESLQKGGTPCTRGDLESRFSQYLEEKTKDKTKSKVRFVVD
jgi:hypothetical protein